MLFVRFKNDQHLKYINLQETVVQIFKVYFYFVRLQKLKDVFKFHDNMNSAIHACYYILYF